MKDITGLLSFAKQCLKTQGRIERILVFQAQAVQSCLQMLVDKKKEMKWGSGTNGLKKYIKNVVLSRMQLKPKEKGLSLSTVRQLLIREGFSYTKHKKALYFASHKHLDIVKNHKDQFIPAMLAIRPFLVSYKVGNVEKVIWPTLKEREKPPSYCICTR